MSKPRGAQALAPIDSAVPAIAGQTPGVIAAAEARTNQFLADARAVIGGEVSKAQLWHDVEMFEQAAALGVLGSGIRLVLLKRMCDHGEFGAELERRGIHVRTAQMRMAATVKLLGADLGKVHRMTLGDLGIRKLLELATLDDDQIDQLAQGEEVLQLTMDKLQMMSHRELREKLRKTEAKLDAAKAAHNEDAEAANELKRANQRLQRDWAKRPLDERVAERRRDLDAQIESVEAALGDYQADAPQFGLAGAIAALLNDATEADGGTAAQCGFIAGALARLETSLRALRDSLPVELPNA